VDGVLLTRLEVLKKYLPDKSGKAPPWLSALLQDRPKLLSITGWTLPKTWVKAVGDNNPRVRIAAIRALNELGPTLASHSDALQVVLKAAEMAGYRRKKLQGLQIVFTTEEDIEFDKMWVQQETIQALSELGPTLASYPDALQAILQAATDKNSYTRRYAIQALGGLSTALASSPDALQAVFKAANDEHEDVRQAARQALRGLGMASANRSVRKIVLKAAVDSNRLIRWSAIQALEGLGASLPSRSKIWKLVLNATSDSSDYVRWGAIKTLVGLGTSLASHSDALQIVLNVTADKEWRVGQVAIQALSGLGMALADHPDALQVILQATRDKNWCVRRGATQALCGLGVALVSHLDALQVVLKASEGWEVREEANDVFNKWDIHTFIQGYSNLERQRCQQWVTLGQNPLLPMMLRCIENQWPLLAVDNTGLTILSDGQIKHIALSSEELELLVHPLTTHIRENWKRHGWPFVTFASCIGKTSRYAIKLPEFKASAKLSLEPGIKRRSARVADSKISTSEQLDITGKITLDFSWQYHDLIFVELIGKGSQGEVWRGIRDHEVVAIKRLSLSMDVSPEKHQEMLQEAS
jgi:HEAT repeat protein